MRRNKIEDEGITLREYLELKITHERELREATLREHDTALKLQAAEYERRLDILNHEHERTVAILSTTVSRERFDQYISDELKTDKLREDKTNAHFSRIDRQLAVYAGAILVIIFISKFIPVGFGVVNP